MGYWVNITESNFKMKKEHFAAAYAAMCELNQRDDLKNGGSYGGGGVSANDPRPEGMTYHPAKWFSWMSADYPSEYKTAEEILEALGFEVSKDKEGNIAHLGYDSKIGNEADFFKVIAPFVEDGSALYWSGEDGARWRWRFESGEMLLESVIQEVWG